jgi:hypothetical protein
MAAERNRALRSVVVSCAAASAVIALHAVYGGVHYESPGLLHLAGPAAFWLIVALALAVVNARGEGPIRRWLLVGGVGLPYVGIFGLLHGVIGHAAKLVAFHAGMPPERLEQLFTLVDFVMPDNAFFELTGLASALAAVGVAAQLRRFWKAG